MIKRLLFFLFGVLTWNLSNAQTSTKGKEFWFGFMENLTLAYNGPPTFSVAVSATEFTRVKIVIPKKGVELAYNIGAGETRKITLPSAIMYENGCDVVSDWGFKITADKEISARAFHQRSYFNEASILLPAQMLGTKYTVLTRNDISRFKYPSSFLIVATEDNTRIIITPSVFTASFRPPGKAYEIKLQKGETYQVQATENLSGTAVESYDGKKIAVFCGARQSYVVDKGCYADIPLADNHLYEQINPVQYASKQFVYVPMANKTGDMLSFWVAEDNTEIKFSGGTTWILNKGFVDTSVTKPCFISANKPVFLAQFCKSMSCDRISDAIGDPNMLYVQPVNFRGYSECFYAQESFESEITVICKTKDTGSFKLDNRHPRYGFKLLPDAPDYSYSYITVSEGAHCLTADSGFNAYAYGFKEHDAYTYSIGYRTNVADEVYFYKPRISPNPSNKDLNLIYTLPPDQTINVECVLYDEIGRQLTSVKQLLSSGNNSISFDIKHLAPAIYYLRVVEPERNKQHTFKVVKYENNY